MLSIVEKNEKNYFFFKPEIWFSCLKAWVDVSGVGEYLWGFFQLQDREINDKAVCQAWHNLMKCDEGGGWVKKGQF